MRLTHKHKYKKDSQRFVFDMKDYRKACQKLGQLEDLLEEFNINDINELRTCLENEQKGTEYFENWWNKRFEELLKPKVEALKIIKEKRLAWVWFIDNKLSFEDYNKSLDFLVCETEHKPKKLTQEEYDLLKEVLL